MIKGNLNIDFVTEEILAQTKFATSNDVGHANGLWEHQNITKPSYPSGSAMVHQSFQEQCPEWAHKVKNLFHWVQYSQVTINRIDPGCFIPPHTDTMYKFYKFLKDNDIQYKDTPIRYTLFLTDHKLGHFININGQTLDTYSKGDYTIILPHQVHMVANIGAEPRYTLQVTGITT